MDNMIPSRRDVLCAGVGIGAGLVAMPGGAMPPALAIDAASTDFGRLMTLKPRAFDRPAAVKDNAGLLREATASRVKVAARGQGQFDLRPSSRRGRTRRST